MSLRYVIALFTFTCPLVALRFSSTKEGRTADREIRALKKNHRIGKPTELFGVPIDLRKDWGNDWGRHHNVSEERVDTYIVSLSQEADMDNWTSSVPEEVSVAEVLRRFNTFVVNANLSGVAHELMKHRLAEVVAASQEVTVAVRVQMGVGFSRWRSWSECLRV